jgi:hypothetical protein
MDLAEFLTTSSPWHKCPVSHALEKLDKAQAEKTVAAFAHKEVLASRIAELLTSWSGVKVTASAARRHRRKECSCD